MAKNLLITIRMENAAFEDNSCEAARILADLSNRTPEALQWLGNGGLLKDSNGSTVGGWSVRDVFD